MSSATDTLRRNAATHDDRIVVLAVLIPGVRGHPRLFGYGEREAYGYTVEDRDRERWRLLPCRLRKSSEQLVQPVEGGCPEDDRCHTFAVPFGALCLSEQPEGLWTGQPIE